MLRILALFIMIMILNAEPLDVDREEYIEQESVIEPLEFIINYKFKLENDIPYGEKYGISIPINTLNLAGHHNRVNSCQIDVAEKYVNIKHFSHYTQAESRAYSKKQYQYLLYNLLQEYKSDVLECLMLHESRIDDINLSINSESRTNTLVTLKAYVLVGFDSGVLNLDLYETLTRSSGENSHSRR